MDYHLKETCKISVKDIGCIFPYVIFIPLSVSYGDQTNDGVIEFFKQSFDQIQAIFPKFTKKNICKFISEEDFKQIKKENNYIKLAWILHELDYCGFLIFVRYPTSNKDLRSQWFYGEKFKKALSDALAFGFINRIIDRKNNLKTGNGFTVN